MRGVRYKGTPSSTMFSRMQVLSSRTVFLEMDMNLVVMGERVVGEGWVCDPPLQPRVFRRGGPVTCPHEPNLASPRDRGMS